MISTTMSSMTLLLIYIQGRHRLVLLSQVSKRLALIRARKNYSNKIFAFLVLLFLCKSCLEYQRLRRYSTLQGFLACFHNQTNRYQSPLVDKVPLLLLVPCKHSLTKPCYIFVLFLQSCFFSQFYRNLYCILSTWSQLAIYLW